MKTNNLNSVGGAAAILMGILAIAIGIADLIGASKAFNWSFGLFTVFAFAAIPAISEKVRSGNEGWVRWVTNLAYLGMAVMAIGSFTRIAIGEYIIDPQGWLFLGGFGLWLITVNLFALRENKWPKVLAYLGIAAGIFSCGAELTESLTQIETFGKISAGIGAAIVGPIWIIWLGFRLRKEPA